MYTLTVANRKGGTGKSATSLQFAYFCAFKLNLRVLVIDLDDQCNTTQAITRGGIVAISETNAAQLFSDESVSVESENILLLQAEDTLRNMEMQADTHNIFATNFNRNLKLLNDQFDVCIVDTGPNSDIRSLSALISSDFVLSPITLSRESVDGIHLLISHPEVGLDVIREKLNPEMKFLGVLPNVVEKTNYQKAGLEYLIETMNAAMISTGAGSYALLPKTTAILEAQADGLPVWQSKKTTARDTWNKHMMPTFTAIAESMNLITNTTQQEIISNG